MRRAVVCLVIYCFSAAALAQDEPRLKVPPGVRPPRPMCPLKLEQAPEVRGFKLGQTIGQIRDRFPRARSYEGLMAEGVGVRTIRLGYSDFMQSAEFKDVWRVSLTFLDDNLASFTLNYDLGTHWGSAEEFKTAVAERLGLQQTGWWGHDRRLTLGCEGFDVTADVSAGAMVGFALRGFEGEVDRRRNSSEQQRRDAFKP